MGYVLDSVLQWLQSVVMPFAHFDLLWRMLPVYLNGFLASVYFPPSSAAAVFGGLTALWAGADWMRAYMLVRRIRVTQANWIIAYVFCAYGAIALIVGLVKIARLYKVFGRRSILTFFAISLYPVQAVYLKCDLKALVGIVVMAAPAVLLLEIFAVAMRKKVLRVDQVVPSP